MTKNLKKFTLCTLRLMADIEKRNYLGNFFLVVRNRNNYMKITLSAHFVFTSENILHVRTHIPRHKNRNIHIDTYIQRDGETSGFYMFLKKIFLSKYLHELTCKIADYLFLCSPICQVGQPIPIAETYSGTSVIVQHSAYL